MPRDDNAGWTLVFGAWLVAAVATLGALFFSEVMDVAPCVLCWWQRIFMFPLVLLLPFGLFPFDARIARAALAMALPGLAVALFHLGVVAGVVPERMQPCTRGVPCAEQAIAWFGFVTIPLMSAVAFASIIVLAVLAARRKAS